MDGNQENIKDHKKQLIAWTQRLIQELRTQLSYHNFATDIKNELGKSAQFMKLKDDERSNKILIKELEGSLKVKMEEVAKETEELNLQITELKQRVNEAEVENKLHIQYLQCQIEGKQSCKDREYLKEETGLGDAIKYLQHQLDTENKVNATIANHLHMKHQELIKLNQERDNFKEREAERLTKDKQKIHEDKSEATDEYDRLRKLIEEDDEERKRREELDKDKQEEEQ